MKTNSKILNLDDIRDELTKLYSEREQLEKKVNPFEYYDEIRQKGYNLIPALPKSDLEIAEKDLHDTNYLIASKEDICEKIEQCEEMKKKYSNGYKRIIHKQTSKSVEDKLDRKRKAHSVAKIIAENKVKTVGILGEWGTGKSTFLEYLKEELPKERTKIIDIKATEYSDQEKIWAYFFTNLKENVKKDYKLRFFYLLLRIKKNFKNFFIPLVNLGFVIAIIIVLFKFNLFDSFSLLMQIVERTGNLFNDGIHCFITIFLIIKWVIPLATDIVNSIQTAQNNISPLLKREVDEKLGYKLIAKEYIEEILKVWKNYYFIFCVDELDRCNNNAIMSFLEAVQLLESYEKIQIIYTIDTEIVLNAIKKSGIYNPHNYLKKYVDLKVDLESINTQHEYIESIANDEYEFSEKEIKKILLALENLEINISIRDYIQILNSLSELKERWISEQIMPEKCKLEEVSQHVINWYNSLPIAIFHFAGSFWPQKIYREFKEFKHAYIKVYDIAKNRKIEQQYSNCPAFIKQTRLIDILNVMQFLHEMPPIYRERIEED